MSKFEKFFTGALLALFAVAASAQSDESEDATDETEVEGDGKYIETVLVTGERGDVNVLDRPMTVTGFSARLIEMLGMQNEGDLEVLVPGLQMGNRSQGGGKNEDGHFYMRGIGSERAVNFFSDPSVAVYHDGVWTDQSYGSDGFFDVERVEVARGPQGTTGGKAALAGAISFFSRRPTDAFDMRANLEMTSIMTQRMQVAFGGPLAETGLAYRLGLSYYTGDGRIENVGSGPRDADEPDQTIITPQLRWQNDRWDVNVRYSMQRDTGTQRASLPLGARNTVDEFVLNPGGERICAEDPNTGEMVCQRNPYFGTRAAPSVENCSNINNDGTRDDNNVICDPSELQWKVAFNAPIAMDNSSDNLSFDVVFAVDDNLKLNYKFGFHDVVQDTLNDGDQLDRQGGGTCLFNHPKVLSGQLSAGQTSRWCALDGGGVGSFADSRVNYVFTSEQTSHEISLYSQYEGPFNFTLGAVFIQGDEPYVYKDFNHGTARNDWSFSDSSAACEAMIESLYGVGGSRSNGVSWLLRDVDSNPDAMARAPVNVYACPGSPEITGFSDTGSSIFPANPNGHAASFFGNTAYETTGFYFNGEYILDDTWKVFGGVRTDEDRKDHKQNAFGSTFALPASPEGTCTTHLCTDGIAFVQIALRASGIAGFEDKGDGQWDNVSWNVGAEYTPNSDVMFYGRISTGYRPGGFVGWGRMLPPFTWEAEEMTNYEAGVKGLYFENKLQLSATVYHQDFKGYWVYASRLRTPAEVQLDPFAGPTTGEVSVIDGTTINGLELEGALRLGESFTLRGFYDYIDTNIADFLSIYPFDIPGQSRPWQQLPWVDSEGNPQATWIRAGEVEFGGKTLPNQPGHKGSLTLAYDMPIPADMGELELLTIMNYRGKKYVELGNIEAYAIDPYTRWDVRATWRTPGWTVTAYVQNVLNEAALHYWSPIEGAASPWGTIVEPREFGVSISWQNSE